MRSLLTTLAVCLTAAAVQAQSFYAGVRTGASYLIRQKDNLSVTRDFGNNYAWEKEVFLRMQGRRNWAFEIGMNNWSSSTNMYSLVHSDESAWYQNGRIKQNNYALDLSAQYKIGFKCLNHVPVFRHLKTYAGIKVTSNWMNLKGTYHIVPTVTPAPEENYVQEDHFMLLSGAVTHTMMYEISPRFQLTSVAAFCMTPFYIAHEYAYPYEQPRARISLQLGAAYKF